MPPLVAKIEGSTNAMTKLTNEISLLVQSNTYMQKSFDEIKIMTKENVTRIGTLERDNAVRKSGDAVVVWVKRTVVVCLVAAVFSLVIISK